MSERTIPLGSPSDTAEVHTGGTQFSDGPDLDEVLIDRERELRESQRVAQLGSWHWAPSTGAVYWSDELYRIHGCDPRLPPPGYDEHLQWYTPESRDRLDTAVRNAFQTGQPYQVDLEFTLPDGTHRWVTGRGEVEMAADGTVVALRGTAQDITERKLSEERLALSEARYRSLVRATTDLIAAGKVDRTEMDDIAEWQAFTGLTDQETRDLGWAAAIHPDDRDKAVTRWLHAMAHEEPFELEQRVRRHDGVYRHMLVRGNPVRDRSGKVVEWISAHNDITERKTAEEALRQTQARFQKLFESDLMGIGVPDRFGAFSEANDELLRIVGYTRSDLDTGKLRWDLMTPPEYAVLDQVHIAEAAERGSCTPYEKEFIRKDGVRVPILCGYTLLEGSQDKYIGFVQDLTRQKVVEAALREREERFRVLAESLPQLVWIRDAAGRYSYCNQRLLDYVGKSIDWMQMHAWEAVHPDDVEIGLARWKQCLETGDPYENEYRLRRHDGVYRWFLARAVPIRNEAGQVERWLGSSTDVHNQKLAEDALRRSEKLATAGRLAASMAHEINNPLASVTNSVYLALQDAHLSPETRRLLREADEELVRVAQFTTQTLRFHKQSASPAPVNLGDLMDTVLAMYSSRLRASGAQVEREYRTREMLLCFSSELRQVFANLIGNALDAVATDGRIRVRIHTGRAWNAGSAPGIRVSVSDNGAGISPETREKLFEPFFSTKENTGVGLGLWVTLGIVQKHHGRIAVRSNVDPGRHGTTFTLFFPFAQPAWPG